MLHLIKLSVGPKDAGELRALQAARAGADPPLRHLTRVTPKRAAEIAAGGSIYWVVGGWLRLRQRVLEIRPDRRADGTACAALLLDPALVAVEGRPVKAFQGWRYLEPGAAPPDLAAGAPAAGDALPPALRRALTELCLL